MHTIYLLPLALLWALAVSTAAGGGECPDAVPADELVISQYVDGRHRSVPHSVTATPSGGMAFVVGPFETGAPLYVEYRPCRAASAAALAWITGSIGSQAVNLRFRRAITRPADAR